MEYNQLSVNYRAYEICIYYPCVTGIETLTGLYLWESNDPSNRVLIAAKDYEDAKKMSLKPRLLIGR